MFFLFNNTNNLLFYQIFSNVSSHQVSDNSIIHSIPVSPGIKDIPNIKKNIPLHTNINFKICVLDNYILFYNIDTKENTSFTFKTTLLTKSDEKFIFENKYSKITEKIPIFMDNDYNQVLHVNFKIYKINENLYFINHFDKILNETKEYFVSSLNNDKILDNIKEIFL